MQRIKITSTNIEFIGYDIETLTLEVEFKSGSIYRYFHVPEYLYQRLINASSHGKFLDDYIKNNYRYQKVE
jgi:hypothetical protein